MKLEPMNFLLSEITIFRTFKMRPLYFFSLLLLAALSSQLINSANGKLQELITSREGITGEVWAYASLQIVLTFLSDAMLILMAASTLFTVRTETSFWQQFNLFLIESLRSWGKILLGLLCFIIPGLVLFMRYLLVPFVVLFDPEYNQGKKDALAQSRHFYSMMTAGQWLLVISFKIVIPIVLALIFEQVSTFETNPSLFLVRQFLEVCCLLLLVWMMKNFIQAQVESESQINLKVKI